MNPSELQQTLQVQGIGGKSVDITPEIPTSAGAYSIADCVGGLLQLQDVMTKTNGTAILKSIQVKDDANQKQPLTILIFGSQPSGATTTDNAAFAYGSSSFPKQIAKFNVGSADYETIDSKATADIDTFGKVLTANESLNLWAVIITTGTPTYAANSTTLFVTFGFLQD